MWSLCCRICCGEAQEEQHELHVANAPQLGLSDEDVAEVEISRTRAEGGSSSARRRGSPAVCVAAQPQPKVTAALAVGAEVGTPRSPHTTSKLAVLSPDARMEEKLRLQKLVQEFAEQTKAGFPVSIYLPETGESVEASFQMDRYLSNFDLLSKTQNLEQILPATHVDLTQVFAVSKGSDVFENHPDIPASVANGKHLVALTLKDPPGGRLFFVFADKQKREIFYTCLKILRLSLDIVKSPEA
eukprot:GHVT01029736.1.p1 GENE.GHVT01029736.1~~GHVT01029736.1.p1  ORF type:complete len:243 (-),score=44.70 GHVT01029736.1:1094-1822(-)